MNLWTASFLISVLLNAAGMLANYLHYQNTHWLLFGIKSFGGEITMQTGFGWTMVHIYTMEMNGHDTVSLKFSPLSLIPTLIAFTLIAYVILRLIRRIRGV
ncbi:MAG: hypothetical protein J6S26_02540 [Solobacterium sp.]|nr:hypothetical protein [Solobacterium sp.]